MKTQSHFLHWLSKKLYLATAGFYLTIGLVMVTPPLVVKTTGLPLLVAGFIAFFVVIFLRTAYESVVIYEAPLSSLSPQKMSIFALTSATVMGLVTTFLQSSLGYFSIPISVIISLLTVGKLKAKLWQTTHREDFFAQLPTKLSAIGTGRYLFFAILVGITYFAYGKYNLSFPLTFATAFFIGMIVEELYNLTKVYEYTPNLKMVTDTIMWSALCTFAATTIIVALISALKLSGPTATIISVFVMKLVQPLGSYLMMTKLWHD